MPHGISKIHFVPCQEGKICYCLLFSLKIVLRFKNSIYYKFKSYTKNKHEVAYELTELLTTNLCLRYHQKNYNPAEVVVVLTEQVVQQYIPILLNEAKLWDADHQLNNSILLL